MKCNPRSNKDTADWYERRGFQGLNDGTKVEVPHNLAFAFHKTFQDTTFEKYMEPSVELTWLKFDCDPKLAKLTRQLRENTPYYPRMLNNPLATLEDCLAEKFCSVYAHFPGKVSLAQYDNCAPDSLHNPLGFELITHEAFSSSMRTTQPVLLPGHPNGRVHWSSRCYSVSVGALDEDIAGLFLAWMQRHTSAPLWKERISIIPLSIVY